MGKIKYSSSVHIFRSTCVDEGCDDGVNGDDGGGDHDGDDSDDGYDGDNGD